MAALPWNVYFDKKLIAKTRHGEEALMLLNGRGIGAGETLQIKRNGVVALTVKTPHQLAIAVQSYDSTVDAMWQVLQAKAERRAEKARAQWAKKFPEQALAAQ